MKLFPWSLGLVCALSCGAFGCSGPVAPPPFLAACVDSGPLTVRISGRSVQWPIEYHTTAIVEDDGTAVCWHVAPNDDTRANGGWIGGAVAGGGTLGPAAASPSDGGVAAGSGATSSVRPLNASTTVTRGGVTYTVTFTGSFNSATCRGSGSWNVVPSSGGAAVMDGSWAYP